MSLFDNEIKSRKEAITKCISESEDLITALESIGAMYGIPASNILEDNSLDRINIVNDTIIAPNKKNINFSIIGKLLGMNIKHL